MRYFFLFLLLLSRFASAQEDSVKFSPQVDFLFFLLEHKQFDDFNFYGNKLLNDSSASSELKDSVHFLLGDVNTRLKNDSVALVNFSKVSVYSNFYYASHFKAALLLAERKETDSSYHYTSGILVNEEDTLVSELKQFELAGLSLLKRDYPSFNALTFHSNDTLLQREYNYLDGYSRDLQTMKRKSPLLAGCLSAIIPGLGKVYAGKNGQALASFLKVAPVGLIALENYLENGYKDPQFIIYASLFSMFYIGNIWGSVLSVQITRNEKLNEINHNILVGLRIPVDKLFR